MEKITYDMTLAVKQSIDAQTDKLKGKISAYLGVLEMEGHNISLPYSDKIEGYKNLHELRPHVHNTEFRLLYYWHGNHVWFVNSFIEKGKKKENRREYDKADEIRNIMEGRR